MITLHDALDQSATLEVNQDETGMLVLDVVANGRDGKYAAGAGLYLSKTDAEALGHALLGWSLGPYAILTN